MIARPDVDTASLRAWNLANARSRAEYRHLPATTRSHVEGPCITGCGRTARTLRGVCRACLRSEGDT